ncbi:MAG: glycosyltransferase family 9 protein [Rhodospirillales bacterium]|nr:glycosyltransferase family 9 protein [Rhodospirillales bacterium]MBT3907308.1 glycosyltransferase family 9 protein [Rhodospirillaceae bacterium]MBT5034975.1 glycosyltransferase family 9 protein [Rhodospirillaceae bacterium]MBT6221752.1 glycosyltransferase family 9 protein [Rhodospirillaceae bacterium]MBT6361936.1 glycosyltransferase family 9 protein [Rhodospirillaceae bacterium]
MNDAFQPTTVTVQDLGLSQRPGPTPAPSKVRWWIFRLIEALACLGSRVGEPHGLVAIRMDGIGDMVLFCRSLDRYAAAFEVEKSDITVLGCHAWGQLAEDVFKDYRVVSIHEHRFHKKIFYRFKIARWMYKQNFKVAVLDSFFRKPLMADSLMMAARAPKTIACVPHLSPKTNALFAYSLSRMSQVIETGAYPVHETIRHYRFLSGVLGRTVEPEPVQIPWRDTAPPVPSGKPYVILNFGSNEYGRRWPFDNYVATAHKLLAIGYRVVFCGATFDNDHKALIKNEFNSSYVVDLIGETTVPELMDLIKHSAGMLTNDTGPAHLGIALGTPTLVLVGGGHFGSFVPYPDEVRPNNAEFLHVEMDCYHCFWGCHLRTSDRDSFPCVAAIEEASVWEVLATMIKPI